jgi:hypothetical protein
MISRGFLFHYQKDLTTMPDLSKLIDEALSKEEYHRDKLLFWKKKRQDLERELDHQQQNVISQALGVMREKLSRDR